MLLSVQRLVSSLMISLKKGSSTHCQIFMLETTALRKKIGQLDLESTFTLQITHSWFQKLITSPT